ncbi:MAG TPA: BrnT family toxin [Bryobacteraceae bacterium]|jgi:hypothetical protein
MGSFEWDDRKSRSNLRKHGIDFETASRAFDDPRRVTFLERIRDGEERWHLIALVPNTMLMLVVSHTYPDQGDENLVRIISARRASKHEEKIYDEENA